MSVFHRNNTSDVEKCFYLFTEDFESTGSVSLHLGVLIFAMFFIIVTNILLIHGIRATKTSRTLSLTKKLFVCLSIIDLFTGISVPYQISMLFISREASCIQIAIQGFTNAFTPALSMFILLSISVTRYLSVTHEKFYLKHVRHPKVTIVLIGQALATLSCTIWYVVATQSGKSTLLGYFFIFVTFLCFGTIGTAVIFNIRLLYFLKRCKEKSLVVKGKTTNTIYQTEVARTLLLISFILVLCYFPNGIVFSFVGYHVFKGDYTYNYYLPWVHIPMLLNAGINSLLYMCRNKKILSYYKKLFCRKEEDANLQKWNTSVSVGKNVAMV